MGGGRRGWKGGGKGKRWEFSRRDDDKNTAHFSQRKLDGQRREERK